MVYKITTLAGGTRLAHTVGIIAGRFFGALLMSGGVYRARPGDRGLPGARGRITGPHRMTYHCGIPLPD